MRRRWLLLFVLFVSCAGTARSCSACGAESFGSDWVIVQQDMSGRPTHCWLLHDTSVANEDHSDGIYWQSRDGHLVHLSNLYVRVQVANGDFDGALRELGLTRANCDNDGGS